MNSPTFDVVSHYENHGDSFQIKISYLTFSGHFFLMLIWPQVKMSVSAVWQIKVYSSHSDSEHSLLPHNCYTCPHMKCLQCTLHLRVLSDFLTPSSIYFLLLVNALFSYLTKKHKKRKAMVWVNCLPPLIYSVNRRAYSALCKISIFYLEK